MTNNFIDDKELVEIMKLDPDTLCVTDPNDPFWDEFDFDLLLQKIKGEDLRVWTALQAMSKDELRDMVARSGTVYKHTANNFS